MEWREKEKVFSMPDGGAVGTSLITVGMDFPPSHQHTHIKSHKHTCRATSCHSTPPAQHLVIKVRPNRALIFSGERTNQSNREKEWKRL